MNLRLTEARRRALCLYVLGQVAIVGGAAAMSWLHSMLPMALGASAAVMLTVPLVRDLAAGGRG